MDLVQGLGKIWTIRSGFAASSCTGGSWTPRHSKGCTAKATGQRVSTTTLVFSPSKMSAPGYWVATCSGRFAVHGKTIHGKVGGGTIRRTTCLFLCSRITRGLTSPWKAAPRSTSSPTDRRLRSSEPKKRPKAKMSGSAAVSPSFVSICLRTRSTRCTWPCHPSSWVKASISSPESIFPASASPPSEPSLEKTQLTSLSEGDSRLGMSYAQNRKSGTLDQQMALHRRPQWTTESFLSSLFDSLSSAYREVGPGSKERAHTSAQEMENFMDIVHLK